MEGLEATKLWKGGCFHLISNVFWPTKWEHRRFLLELTDGRKFPTNFQVQRSCGKGMSEVRTKLQPHEVLIMLKLLIN